MYAGDPDVKATSLDVESIVLTLGKLFASLHEKDQTLQNSLSGLDLNTTSADDLAALQHIDLVTQAHFDLSQLMPHLARAVSGTCIEKNAFDEALILESLKAFLLGNSNSLGGSDETADALTLF